MRAVAHHSAGARRQRRARNRKESASLDEVLSAAGLPRRALFGWSKKAYRRVQRVSSAKVSLDCDGRTVTVPRKLLPSGVTADQWLRFEIKNGKLVAAVDLRATLRAESRVTDLLQVLFS